MSDLEGNRAVVRRWYDAFNAREFDVIDQLFSADVRFHGMQAQGTVALKEECRAMAEVFDMRTELEDLIAEGDLVAARLKCAGTHVGDAWGKPPTGKTFSAPEVDVWRLQDGRIVEAWVVFDELRMNRQLGFLPEG